MPHYVCTGTCGGVSETPGTCQAEDCPRHEHALAECSCKDAQHEEVLGEKSGE